MEDQVAQLRAIRHQCLISHQAKIVMLAMKEVRIKEVGQ